MCFSCSGDDANGGCFFEECGEVETMCGWRDLIEIDLDSTRAICRYNRWEGKGSLGLAILLVAA